MYSITEMGKITGLPASTLRYYEQLGILPHVDRNDGGRRVYSETVLEWLELVVALKDTGMSLEEIKAYTHLIQAGDETLNERRELLMEHKRDVEMKIAKSQVHLEKIVRKIAVYDVLAHQKAKRRDPLI